MYNFSFYMFMDPYVYVLESLFLLTKATCRRRQHEKHPHTEGRQQNNA